MKRLTIQISLIVAVLCGAIAYGDESSSGGLGGKNSGKTSIQPSYVVSESIIELLKTNFLSGGYTHIEGLGELHTLSIFATPNDSIGAVVQRSDGEIVVLFQVQPISNDQECASP